MRVKIKALNFRSEPVTTNGNIIGVLPMSHDVDVISGPTGNGFCEIETVFNGETRRGFVAHRFLRDEVSPFKERLLEEAVKEWIFFHYGEKTETQDGWFQRVGDYWQRVGENIDGRDTDSPWSAAFISFIVRAAAGYSDFKFSTAHAEYIGDAKRKRIDEQDGPYWLFKLSEHRPQLGDLICGWRVNSKTYDDVTATSNFNFDQHFFKSHTDVIVQLNDTEVMTIGGNVSHSVKHKTFKLNASGFLSASIQTGDNKKIFAIMRNNR